MKGIFKKTLSMILCFVMVFTMFQGTMLSASAKVVGPDNKTELTITTDKSKYSWGDTIIFNITVKNVSNETLKGIKINSFAREVTQIAQQGDLPVIPELQPGESKTVQIEYYATKLASFLIIFMPIFWLFSPAGKIAYREANFNYEQKVRIGLFRHKVGFGVEYNTEVVSEENFSVSFNLNYFGSADSVPTQHVKSGEKVTEPSEPSREGFLFDGWYADDTELTPYDFDMPVFQDLVLVAHWVERDGYKDYYDVTFVLNDGSEGAYNVQSVTANGKVVRPRDPEKELFTFTGWYLDPSATTEFLFSTRIKDDLILYAGWKSNSETGGASSASSGGGTIFSITDVTINGNTASASINVNEESVLVLRFYDENNESLLGLISIRTPDYCEIETIDLPITVNLPEFFLVTADLYDFDANQRCETFRSIKYTSKYKEFMDLTVNDFSGQTVLNFDEDPTNNFGVLSDNVIKIRQSTNKNILNQTITVTSDGTDNYTYTFSHADSQISALSVGDVVYAKNSEGNDCVFKVGTIVKDGNTYTITQSPENELTDYYDVIKVDMLLENNNTKQEDSSVSAQVEVIDIDDEHSFELSPLNLKWDIIPDKLKLSGVVKGTVSIELVITYDAHLFRKDYFYCSYKATTEIEASVKLTAYKNNDDAVDERMKERYNKELKFPALRIPTPIAGLGIKVETGVPIELSAEGSIEFKFTTKNVSGFTYSTDAGRQDYDKKERTFDIHAEGKLELKVGPKLEIGITFLDTVVKASVYVQAGGIVTATATLEIAEWTTADSKHGCALCVDITAKWFVEVGVKLTYDIIKDILSGQVFDLKIVDIEGQIKFGDFPNFYISLIHSADSVFGTVVPKIGLGDCPNKKYRTTIRLLDDNGEEISGNSVDVYKSNNVKWSSKDSTYVDYLYDGKYTVKTKIDGVAVEKSFVVSGSAQELNLKKTSGDGSISGEIVSSDNNAPIKDATILVSKGGLVVASIKSDASGKYSVKLPDGTYCVKITKDGYIPFTEYVIVKDATDSFVQTALMITSANINHKGGFKGKVVDDINAAPVKDVTLKIYNGWNNLGYESYVTMVKTNNDGEYISDNRSVFGIQFGLPCGNYSAVVSKPGYATTYVNFVVEPDTVKDIADIVISKVYTGEYRIVLSWGASPSDLDSHVVGTLSSGATDHIYYSHKYGSSGNLDRDDTDSYGPETITITDFDQLSNGFTYIVHDFSNKSYSTSKALSNSGAVVKLYDGSTLLDTFYVPTDTAGTAWRVFSIDANGQVKTLNEFYAESDAASVR